MPLIRFDIQPVHCYLSAQKKRWEQDYREIYCMGIRHWGSIEEHSFRLLPLARQREKLDRARMNVVSHPPLATISLPWRYSPPLYSLASPVNYHSSSPCGFLLSLSLALFSLLSAHLFEYLDSGLCLSAICLSFSTWSADTLSRGISWSGAQERRVKVWVIDHYFVFILVSPLHGADTTKGEVKLKSGKNCN